ncbi:hypothetical protein ABOM_001550 [Aspergillus bombycis]|uniref:Amine oxidase domain-containing protein n=1 Tax=Aspergillus bombycis TaxID=109264 RepID=A0A1F8ADQ1_9EURO|nr:hypothetical protein ABOM_001550 [Aspergillus bombycis]OGM49781.1 hypothetical protein ABOM_001550 [Aspergillus bombycis]
MSLLRFVTEIQLAHPQPPGTGLVAYIAVGLMDVYGLAVPRGAGKAFTSAIIRCLEAHRGEIQLNTEVTKIVTEKGRAVGVRTRAGEIRAKECVVAQIHPHIIGRLVDGLDTAITDAASKNKLPEFSLLVIHAALEKLLKFRAGAIANNVVMNTICPNRVDELLHSYHTMATGEIPDGVMVGASCVNIADPLRAPPGKVILHAVIMVRANNAEVGFHGWDAIKDDVVFKVFNHLTQYHEDFTPDQIRAYHVVTPSNHEEDTPSFQQGDIYGLAMSSDQMGLTRPTPALSQYRVPDVQGLYLAGPFMHPGGGVWGGGRPVAMRVMEDMGIDFESLFRASVPTSHL